MRRQMFLATLAAAMLPFSPTPSPAAPNAAPSPAAPNAAPAAEEHVVDGQVGDWTGQATMAAGTAGYDAGEWAYTDYVYDDNGTGSVTYPSGTQYGINSSSPGNAADVAVLRVAPADDGVHFLAELNTMLRADLAVVAIAVDTDLNDATGGGVWPYGSKLSSPGWEYVVTAWGTGATATTPSGQSTAIPVAADITANIIEFSLPTSLADSAGSTWRLHAASGVWNPTTAAWHEAAGKTAASNPNVYNLMFRNRAHDQGSSLTDENNSGGFQSARQQTALRAGDITPFARTIDFSLLEDGITLAPEEPPGDVHITRIYASAGFPNKFAEGLYGSFSLEGMDLDGNIYNGRFHPYRLFVPSSYRESSDPAPLLPMLHGWGGNHRSWDPSPAAFWTDVVRPQRALVAKVFGRGQRVWYEHLGELDVLEVIDDVKAHYNVDEDRVYIGGASMGGLGAIKIAEAHPDVFAGMFPGVPPTGDRATTLPLANEWDLIEHTESLRNMPVRVFTGTVDYLVALGLDTSRFCARMKVVRVDHDCWRDLTGGHTSYDSDRAPQIAEMLNEHRRVNNPQRVEYEVHPFWRQQAIDKGIDHVLRYDRAYWVSGIEYRQNPVPLYADCRAAPNGKTCFGELDVQSHALRHPVYARPFVETPAQNLVRDGMELSAVPMEGQLPTPTSVGPTANAFSARFVNLSAADLDLERMGLTLDGLAGEFTNDSVIPQPIELGLLGDYEGTCAATLGGFAVPVTHHADGITLSLNVLPLPAGPGWSLTISCS